MRVSDTENGLMFLRDDREPCHMDVLYDDPKYGTWLLIGTRYQTVEVRVSPGGRKVTAERSKMTLRALTGDDDE